ncbi:MAG TPA: hypothetical protein P5543_10345 [Planctomycetota bacterium]|nr:hypothetical protein [Planctomycetota bacterium]
MARGESCSGGSNFARGWQMLLGEENLHGGIARGNCSGELLGGEICSGELLGGKIIYVFHVFRSLLLNRLCKKIKIYYSHLFPLFFSNFLYLS